jgi:hypothetical protein
LKEKAAPLLLGLVQGYQLMWDTLESETTTVKLENRKDIPVLGG